MAPAGGGDETGESVWPRGPLMNRGVDRSAAAGVAASQNLGSEYGSRKRNAAVMSIDLTSLVGNGEHSKVAYEGSQRILMEIEDLRAQLDADVKELGYCEANQKLRVELAQTAKEMWCLRKQNEEMQSKNDGIRKENEELQAKNDGMVKQNKDLQAKNDGLVKENEKLISNIDGISKQNVQLQIKNDSLTTRNEELLAKNGSLTEQNEELKAKNVYLVKQNEEVQANNDSMRKRNGELQAENAGLKKLDLFLQVKNNGLTKSNEELQAKNDRLTKWIGELEAKNVSLTKQNEELKAKNVDLVKQNEEVQANNDSMRKRNGELQAENSGLTKLNEGLQVKNDGLTKSTEELQAKNDRLTKWIGELEDKNDDLEDLNGTVASKERQSNDELLQARKDLTTGLRDELNGRSAIGTKRMGELEEKPFQNACKRKYGDVDYQTKAAKLVESWQDELKDPSWHPFVVVQVNGEHKEVLDEDDAKLKLLRSEYGDDVCNAVKTALMEINEYNPSERYAVPVFWNFRKRRKATIKEVLYLYGHMEETTAKRRRG